MTKVLTPLTTPPINPPPEETMLIDDASVNCRAAEELGMRSYMPQPGEDWSHLFPELAD